MSILRNRTHIAFECDDCGDTFETDVVQTGRSSFSSAVAEIKEAGWTLHRDEDSEQWFHLCEICSEEQE